MIIFGGQPLSPDHHIVREPHELQAMVTEMQSARTRGLDFETDGLRYANGQKPIGACVGYMKGRRARCWYVPVAHQTAEVMADPHHARQAVKDALAGAESLVGHHLKFDLNMARGDGWEIDPDVQLHDTYIQAPLIYERRGLNLEAVAAEIAHRTPWGDSFASANAVKDYLRQRAKDRRMTFSKSNKEKGIKCYMDTYGHAEVPVVMEGEYSCRDVAHALHLDEFQRDRAMGIGTHYEAQRRYLYHNEMLLVRALADMEWQGQCVDATYLRQQAIDMDRQIWEIGQQLAKGFGATVDWGNDNAVRHFLYEHLKLPVVKRTKKDKLPAVARSALLQLRAYHPSIELLAEYNAWAKARGTYTNSLAWWVCRDGRVHPSFIQGGAKSGRMSGRDPNFQNIPTRHKATAERIRRAFIIEEGMARIYCDYSQIELRMLAWISGCVNLHMAYLSPAYDELTAGRLSYDEYRIARQSEPSVDVHGAQAIATFGANPDGPDWKNKRRAAKVINFGVPYGMGPPGLTSNPDLMLSNAEAENYFSMYHSANPELAVCKNTLFTKMLNERKPHFVNWAGRTVHSPELRSGSKDTRGEGERSSFASLVQGAAAELTKFSIVALWKANREGRIPAVGTSTVHDEIQMDCRVEDAPLVARETQRIMEDFAGLFGPIPVVADLEITTTNWADKKDYHP